MAKSTDNVREEHDPIGRAVHMKETCANMTADSIKSDEHKWKIWTPMIIGPDNQYSNLVSSTPPTANH